MVEDKKLLAFKRLNLADLCFKRAEALAQHVIDTHTDPLGLLYSPMMSGIVVTYMRPFVQADGLGLLPVIFSEFSDVVLRFVHEHLKEARHKLYAHQDIKSASDFITDDGSTPFDMWITFDGTKCVAFRPGVIEIAQKTLPDIVRLCQHQKALVKQTINDAWPSLTGGKTYPPGCYHVGVDFP